MDRKFRKRPADQASCDPPPSEAWLFAQALLGNPIPDPRAAAERAKADREYWEWLAAISPEHGRELRKRQNAVAEARHQRELLVWLAQISTEHAAKLRAVLAEERAAREAQQRYDQFYEAYAAQEGWDPSKHPRFGGPPNAGWFASAGGSSGGSSGAATARQLDNADDQAATPEMLELAYAWWETNKLLQRARHDIETLPAVIAGQQAKLAHGDGYPQVHWRTLAKAQQQLQHAKSLVPALETQLHDLEQQYHDSGYDDVPYGTWTSGEMVVGGRGIKEVGLAAAMHSSPAGLRPTGIEFDIVSAALAGPAILRLGKAVLGRAAAAAERKAASEGAALRPYGGVGGGHHVPAKSAFEGALRYSTKEALAIPRDELKRLGVTHAAVTGAQQTLYREFAKSGAKLTWEEVARIETEALVRGGLKSEVASATVEHAIAALKKAGVPNPTRIPWSK